MQVKNMTGRTGRAVANQFIIKTVEHNPKGDDVPVVSFQSYGVIIAQRRFAKVFLDKDHWDYSTTTGKYRNQFLGETKRETEKKIKSGEYVLVNLN